MNIKSKQRILFLALLLGSFSDEAVQIIFALTLGNAEKIYLTSLLLMLGMIGGISANVVFSQLSQRVGIKNMVVYCLILEAVFIVLSSVIQWEILYLIVAFLLGILGGMLWSAVLIMIPMLAENKTELEKINKYAHLIRNLGFVVGPMIGGGLMSIFSAQIALLLIGLITLCSALLLIRLSLQSQIKTEKAQKAVNGFLSIVHLLRNNAIRVALLPLSITIICTSALSVLIIVYFTDIIQLPPSHYGLYSASISLSLALSPLLLTRLLSTFGDAVGACLSAALIGLGLLMLSLTEHYLLLVFWGVIMGAFNGTQNTIMSAFMLKQISPEQRENQMPAYVLILQLCVFIGFLCSMFVRPEQIGFTFVLLGSITIITGLIGAVVNRRMQKNESG